MSGLGIDAAGVGGVAGTTLETSLEGPRPSEGSDRSFAEVLRETGGTDGESLAAEMVRDAVESIGRGERMVERTMRQARRGHVFTQEELLAVQAGVYRYTQELELASKLVDKATGAVRQTLQSQQ